MSADSQFWHHRHWRSLGSAFAVFDCHNYLPLYLFKHHAECIELYVHETGTL